MSDNRKYYFLKLLLPLSHYELNAETYYLRYNDFWQYSQKTVDEHFPEASGSTGSVEMLDVYKRQAQWESQIRITEDGNEILTQ